MSDPAEQRQSAAARRRRQRSRSRSPSEGDAPSAGRAQGGPQGKVPSAGKAQGKAPSAGRARGSGKGGGQGRRQAHRRAATSRTESSRAATSRTESSRAAAPRGTTASASPPSPAGGLRSAHELVDALHEERRRANGLRSRVLAAAAGVPPAVVVGVVVAVVAGIVPGAVSAALAFVVLLLAVPAGSVAFALRMVGGAPVPQGALRALENQVEGLCATLGVAQPELWLVDDPVANACALAGRRGRSVLVVTSGLLSRMGLIEMEGVVAHELVHLKRRDAAVSSVAVATAGVVAWVTGRDALVHLAVGRGREYATDQAAVLAVRYPPGLHDALASMGGQPSTGGQPSKGGQPSTGGQPSAGASPFRGRRWAATRWIWIDPMPGAHEQAPVGELDATKTRVDALAEW